MGRNRFYRLLQWAAPAAVSALLCGSAFAMAQSSAPATTGQTTTTATAPVSNTLPDAAVEANVLKALAAVPDLANQPMTTTTVYGVVTLSGTVETEALRDEAETIVSKTVGVKKVIDEMTLAGESASAQTQVASAPGAAAANGVAESAAAASQGTQPGSAPIVQGAAANANASTPQASSATQAQRGSMLPQQQGYTGTAQSQYGAQEAGDVVTVPSGAMLRVRVNETLDSARVKPGERFDGVVANDVVADGAVAIPRGAAVEGTVVDVKKSGILSGRGELSLQLTQVTMGGKSYPILTDVWTHNGRDKTTQTVNSTAVGGVIGALFGAMTGGGAVAAVGAGLGGAMGMGSSAAAGGGQVYVPAEGLLSFRLAQSTTVATVSQEEMDRLAQGVPVANQPQQLRQRYYPAPYYYGPAFYRPYPYYYPYPYY